MLASYRLPAVLFACAIALSISDARSESELKGSRFKHEVERVLVGKPMANFRANYKERLGEVKKAYVVRDGGKAATTRSRDHL